jgi:hypothetical protein
LQLVGFNTLNIKKGENETKDRWKDARF